jgi:uncharacterized protein (DUF1330 family)
MSSFFLAEIEVLDPEEYRAYVERASQIVEKYDGEYVFRSDNVTPVSGDWSPRQLLLNRFNSKADIHMCFASKEYLEIKHLREQSTKSRAVIIEEHADANKPDAGAGK